MDSAAIIAYHTRMLDLYATTLAAVTTSAPAPAGTWPMENPAGILAVLLAVLAVIFWAMQQKAIQPLFKIIPALVFCYFIPTTLTTLGILPAESELYSWIRGYVLPTALFLLILSLDLPGIMRLGPKAVIMLLAGTAGVVIGGPIALLVYNFVFGDSSWALPLDSWKGLASLSGSWIGGGANFVAIGDVVGVSDTMLATMVIPDVFVASIWMGVLLYCSGHQERIDRWTGADASAIRNLEQRLTDFQQRVMRVASPGRPADHSGPRFRRLLGELQGRQPARVRLGKLHQGDRHGSGHH